MSTDYHNPHATGFPLDADEFNLPLGQLDSAIGRALAEGASFPGAPDEGDRFFRTDQKLAYQYLNGKWRPIPYVHNIEIPIDGGGSAITSGEKWPGIRIPWNCEIVAWYLVAEQSGSISIDLQVDTYANFPPTAADSIVASAPPSLSSAQKDTDATLTGWATQLTEGDWLRVYVDSATTVTWVNLVLVVELNDGT